jgi:putative transposase
MSLVERLEVPAPARRARGYTSWARGYFVSTVGRDEATIREYIQNQEQDDQRLEQLSPWS